MTMLVVVLLLLLLLQFLLLMQIGLDNVLGTVFRSALLGMLELPLICTLLRHVFVKVHVQEGLGQEAVAIARPFLLVMVVALVPLLCTFLGNGYA